MTKNYTKFTSDSLIISRLVNAPKESVFKAWTDPEIIKQWWAPKGYSAPVVKVDLRQGGKYLYSMQGPDGKIIWSGGEFAEIQTPDRLLLTDYFSDEEGKKKTPADYGLPADFPKETTIAVTFKSEADDQTRLDVIYELPKSAKAVEAMKKSGMTIGWNSSLDKLDEYFSIS